VSRDKSSEFYSKAKGLLPGGVNSPARAWTAVGGCPLFLSRGSGSHVRDVDGNRYIDYVGSWGPLILGHSHPEVLGAIRESLSKGTSFGAPTEAESHLAHLIVGAFPSIDLVRFVNSGTEAAMSALRLSRAFTGRDKIVKFQGGYHGHVDALLVQSGSGAAIMESQLALECRTKLYKILLWVSITTYLQLRSFLGDMVILATCPPPC